MKPDLCHCLCKGFLHLPWEPGLLRHLGEKTLQLLQWYLIPLDYSSSTATEIAVKRIKTEALTPTLAWVTACWGYSRCQRDPYIRLQNFLRWNLIMKWSQGHSGRVGVEMIGGRTYQRDAEGSTVAFYQEGLRKATLCATLFRIDVSTHSKWN